MFLKMSTYIIVNGIFIHLKEIGGQRIFRYICIFHPWITLIFNNSFTNFCCHFHACCTNQSRFEILSSKDFPSFRNVLSFPFSTFYIPVDIIYQIHFLFDLLEVHLLSSSPTLTPETRLWHTRHLKDISSEASCNFFKQSACRPWPQLNVLVITDW